MYTDCLIILSKTFITISTFIILQSCINYLGAAFNFLVHIRVLYVGLIRR